MNTTVLPDFRLTRPVDQVGVEERVARFKARSIKKESKVAGLKLALSMIDLTTLEGMDSAGKVRQLCVKAIRPLEHEGIPSVAAVCVYSPMVSIAKDALRGSDIHVASVATAFPSGMASKQNKLDDVKYALDQGADEIDMVISRGRFLAGDYPYVFDEIAEIKELCGEHHLKVILETGELQTLDNVRRASDIALYAGGDFIKTSTGKVKPAATMEVTLVMFEAIRDFYYKTREKRGMKPAGGIRDSKTALRYLAMLKETLGADWLTPERFRFGASSLANDLLMQIIKQETGRYQSGDYFSID
ncbi:MAG TPA: deoxyribose-phosphate aldolase [Balneolales bacterium]|nr:deoxyribose-phosphate aldolase [Balneolales bacterium]